MEMMNVRRDREVFRDSLEHDGKDLDDNGEGMWGLRLLDEGSCRISER